MMASLLAACGTVSGTTTSGGQQRTIIHLGYFPNLTHAVALVGVQQGIFALALGSNVKLETTTFNAGPVLIEALFARSIDIGYVGPSPAINGFVKSNGAALRIVAGASSGGALFVVRPGADIHSPQDLANKKFASPQLGGTQDVALRYYLQQHGLKTTDQGGNVRVVPTDNGTILSLFKQGKIDGAWVPEPWATRLVTEDHGKIFVDERAVWSGSKFATTVVVVRKDFSDQHPDLVKKFLQGHVAAVQYIQTHATETLTILNSEINQITGQKLMATAELSEAFDNLDITYDPLAATVSQQADRAYSLGFIKSKSQLNDLCDLGPLNAVLFSKGLAQVSGT